ncbi:Uu.00g076440.m01.CDS01 [Anthostomella pinea]|uniref:Uu.00g076440.m01.CDS01 n=1 Tax=Anthostomella pinea TaxID=933095 RepID=A0AAI8YP43_9PEZI|nr:Uu.00g076440.m01.CDS01 [Anthostomella pinea]
MINFDYAYDLYDYALYHYNHDEAVRDLVNDDRLAFLQTLANDQQFNLHGNLSASGFKEGDMIRAFAGRTLPAQVVAQLSESHQAEVSSHRFPNPGGAMVFELFSNGNDTSSYPDQDELWVRFLYRNGTDPDVPLQEYPLFGRGNSETRMHWTDFAWDMERFSIKDIGTWCQTCDAVTLFCTALNSKSDGDGSSSGSLFGPGSSRSVTPAVAGIIGAAVAIVATALAAASTFFFGGLRIQRADKGHRGSLGGFKGAEKMASDHDVSIAKSGARHERVGGWELGGPGPNTDNGLPPNIATVFGASVRRNGYGEDDGDSILGHTPIRPLESI